MYVLDTEKNSFKETVWKRIDFFSELHDKIRAVLKERLLKDEKRTNPLSPK